MKNNSVTTALLGALLVVAIMTAYFLWSYNMAFREFRVLQPKVAAYQNNRLVMQALVIELNEYAKLHPTIDDLLRTFKVKAVTSNAPAATAPKTPAR